MKRIISLALVVIMALLCLASCNKDDDKTIKIGASSTPHAEILRVITEDMADKGYTLDIQEFSDYVLPNEAVEDGDLDANYFQHAPYMEDFNAKKGTHLKAVVKIHYEPYGIYPSKTKTIEDLKEGAKVMVPNDATNEARALQLLQQAGLIKLKDGVGINATKNDITENPLKLEIQEVEAAAIISLMPDADLAIINGNYALTANLKIEDALAVEDLESIGATTYANILCVKEGNEDSEKIKALIECLTSEKVKNYINETYGGAVVPVF